MNTERKMVCGHVPSQHRFVIKEPILSRHTDHAKLLETCEKTGTDPDELFKFHYYAKKKDGSMLKGKENMFLIYGHCAPAMQVYVRGFMRGTIVGMAIDESEELVRTEDYDFPRSTREGVFDHFIMRMSPRAFPPREEGPEKLHTLEIYFNLDLHLGDEAARERFSALRHTGDPRYRRGNILVVLNQGPLLTGMHEVFDQWDHELCHVVRIMENYLFKDSYCAMPGCENPMKFIDVYVVQDPNCMRTKTEEPEYSSPDKETKDPKDPEKPVMVAAYPVCGLECRGKLALVFEDCFKRGLHTSLTSTVEGSAEDKRVDIRSPSKGMQLCSVCQTVTACARCKTPCQKPYCGRRCQRKDWKTHRAVCPHAKQKTARPS